MIDIEAFLRKRFDTEEDLRRQIQETFKIPSDVLDKVDLRELFYYIQKKEYDSAAEWFYTYVYPLIPQEIKEKIAFGEISKLQVEFEEQLHKLFEQNKITIKDLKDIYNLLLSLRDIKTQISDLKKEARKRDIATIKKFIDEVKERTEELKSKVFDISQKREISEIQDYFMKEIYSIKDTIKKLEDNITNVYEKLEEISSRIEELQKGAQQYLREEEKRLVSRQKIKSHLERQRLLFGLYKDPRLKYNLALSALDMILRILKIQKDAIVQYVATRFERRDHIIEKAQKFVDDWIDSVKQLYDQLIGYELLEDKQRLELLERAIVEIERFLKMCKRLNLLEKTTEDSLKNILFSLNYFLKKRR